MRGSVSNISVSWRGRCWAAGEDEEPAALLHGIAWPGWLICTVLIAWLGPFQALFYIVFVVLLLTTD
jgi:hypothetical protein